MVEVLSLFLMNKQNYLNRLRSPAPSRIISGSSPLKSTILEGLKLMLSEASIKSTRALYIFLISKGSNKGSPSLVVALVLAIGFPNSNYLKSY